MAALLTSLEHRRLHHHPKTPCGAVEHVAVDVGVEAGDVLFVRFRIVGEIGSLRIPGPGAGLDPDRLWEHTCCEAFVGPAPGEGYVEWNVSPSGQLACFAFSTYRRRAPSPLPAIAGARSSVAIEDRELRVEAWAPLPRDLGDVARISLTTVIEDAAGALSYWALRHPCDRPDFHHPGGFALALTRGPALAIVDA